MDVIAGNLFVFGGFDGSKMLNDLHIFHIDSMSWSKAVTTGKPPSPRAGHTATSVLNKLFIFGGGDGARYLNDVHVLDTENMEWSLAHPGGSVPSARSRHTATLLDQSLYIVGGGDETRVYNDIHVLDTVSMTWSRPAASGTLPAARWGHTTTLRDKSLVVLGGHDGSVMLNDVFFFDTLSLVWSNVVTTGTAPSPRAGHTSNIVCHHLVVFAGGDGVKIWNDLHLLDLSSLVWTVPTPPDPPPSLRCAHTTILLGNHRLLVFGGGDVGRRFKDLYILDVERLLKLEETKKLQQPRDMNKRKPSSEKIRNNQKSDVTAWLESIGMGRFAPNFVKEDIDMDLLQHLTEQQLAENLGVNTIGARLRIMRAIAELASSRSTPSFALVSAPPLDQQPRDKQIEILHAQLNELLTATTRLTQSIQSLYVYDSKQNTH